MAANPAKPGAAPKAATQKQTLDKVQATKDYLDSYYENVLKEVTERKKRLEYYKNV